MTELFRTIEMGSSYTTCGCDAIYLASASLPIPALPAPRGLNSATSISAPVSWQTAWWSLVPLAIAAMTQPCGNVLGRKDRNFRFYSRASPIICIFDIFYFLILIALATSLDRRKFFRNVKFELKHRFSGDDAPREALIDAERTRAMRWALLLIGGVPCQTIKLAVMDGMFWTKVWAMSYFGSILFWETIGILARMYETNHMVKLPMPEWRGRPWMAALMTLAFHLPLTCHYYVVCSAAGTVFYWLIFSVSDLDFHFAIAIVAALTGLIVCISFGIQILRGKATLGLGHALCYLGFMSLWQVVHLVFWHKTTSPLPTVGPTAQAWETFRVPLDHYLREERLPSKDRFADVLVQWVKIVLGIRAETASHVTFVAFEVLTTTIISLSVPNICSLSSLQKLFRINSSTGSYSVFTFVSTFVFSLIWYCFMFQPVGTYAPSWTEVFS